MGPGTQRVSLRVLQICAFLAILNRLRWQTRVESTAYVALDEGDDRGNFLLTEAVEQQQGYEAVDIVKLRDLTKTPRAGRSPPLTVVSRPSITSNGCLLC